MQTFSWQRLRNAFASLKNNKTMLIILLASIFLNFYNLDKNDLFGDEYTIGFKAYDLVDGNIPGRDAYFLSMKDHSPLAVYNTFVGMQILEPNGFYKMQDWMFRFTSALVGLMSVFAFYLFAKQNLSDYYLIFATALFALCNYVVWVSRMLLREIFLVFFILLSLYAFQNFLAKRGRSHILLTGIAIGGALMTKFSGIIIIPTFLLFVILNYRSRLKDMFKLLLIAGLIFSPVLAFNALAYASTGYMDIPFSKLFGLDEASLGMVKNYPGVPFSIGNLTSLPPLLMDQYSLPVFALMLFGLMLSIPRFKENQLMILFSLFTIAFVWAAGYRAYYLPYITIPLVILAFSGISRFKINKKALTILLSSIVVYAFIFTYNSQVSNSFTFQPDLADGELGRSGGAEPTLNLAFSESSRAFSEEYGYKRLSGYLLYNLRANDRLFIDDRMNPPQREWYLTSKKWTLKYGNPPKGRLESRGVLIYNLSAFDGSGWAVVVSQPNLIATYLGSSKLSSIIEDLPEPIETIYDNSHSPSFYIYKI